MISRLLGMEGRMEEVLQEREVLVEREARLLEQVGFPCSSDCILIIKEMSSVG